MSANHTRPALPWISGFPITPPESTATSGGSAGWAALTAAR
jgi:hypothetical protein